MTNKYIVQTTSDQLQLHVQKATTATPVNADWESQDDANSPRMNTRPDSTIESYWAVLARGAEADVEVTPTGVDAQFATAGVPRIAQSFTSLTGALAAFRFRLKSINGTIDNLVMSLQADNSGEPDGTIIESRQIANADITSSYQDFYFSLKKPLAVSSSDVYWIVLEADAGSDELSFRVEYDDTDVYANGTGAFFNGSVWADLTGNDDLNFSVYLADIHVFTQQLSGRVAYSVFDIGTDTWLVTDELVARVGTIEEDGDSISDVPIEPGVTGALRADGDVVVAFNVETSNNTGSDSIVWVRREEGYWQYDILTSSSDNDRVGAMIGPDSEDRMYVGRVFRGGGPDSVGIPTIRADNTLDFPLIDSDIDTAALIVGPGVIGADNHSWVPYIEDGNLVAVGDWAAADTPSPSTANISDNTVFGHGRATPPYAAMCLAIESDGSVHLVYANDADQDMYHDNDVDAGGGTDVEILNTVTVNRISCTVGIDDINLLILYDDGGVTKYLTVALAVPPSGAGAQILAGLTQAGIGEQKFVADGAQVLANLEQAGVGAHEAIGAGAQTLGLLSQVGAGAQIFSGVGAQTLATLLQNGIGKQIFTATGAQTLQLLTQAGVGLMHPSGTGSQLLAAVLQNGAGAQVFVGSGLQVLAALVQAGVGLMQPSGTAVQLLASLTQAGVGVEVYVGSGIQTLASLTQAGTGAHEAIGTGAQVLAPLTQDGQALFGAATATGDQLLAALTQAGVGVMQPSGAGAQSLTALLQAGVGAEIITATGAQLLASLLQAGVGAHEAIGSGAQLLQVLLQDGQATHTDADTDGSGAQLLQALTQAGIGVEIFAGVGAQTLTSLLQNGVGIMQPSAAGAQILANLTQAGVGAEILTATGAQLLTALTQAGVGAHEAIATGAQLLQVLLQTSQGATGEPDGAGVQLLTSLLQSGVGIMQPSATGSQLLAVLNQAGVGQEIITATGAQTLANLLQSGVGAHEGIGSGAQLLTALTQAGVGVEIFPGAGVQILANLLQAGVGAHEAIATGAQVLANLLQNGQGFTGEATGDGAQLLAALLQSGAGAHEAIGVGAQTLTPLLQAGVGVEIFPGAGAQTLATLLQNGVGLMQPDGSGAQLLASLEQAGVGVEIFKGAGDQTLAGLLQAGVGVEIFLGSGAQLLRAVSQAGVAIRVHFQAGTDRVFIIPFEIRTAIVNPEIDIIPLRDSTAILV